MLATPQTEVPTCAQCGNWRNPNKDYKGSFCNIQCWYAHKGEKALNIPAHDHRLCVSCGRWLKEINRPNQEWKELKASAVETALDHGGKLISEGGELVLDATECPTVRTTAADAVVGFQTRTGNAEVVEKEFQVDDYQRTYATGTGCTCGMTDTRFRDETLQGIELATVLANYVLVFRELEREGQLDKRISKDTFFQTYKDSRDLEYALGKAIYGR